MMPLNPHLRRDAQCLAGDPHSSHKTLACVDSGPHAVVSLPPPALRVSARTGTTPALCRKREPAQRGGTYPVHGDGGPLPVSVLQGLRVQLKARRRDYREPWASGRAWPGSEPKPATPPRPSRISSRPRLALVQGPRGVPTEGPLEKPWSLRALLPPHPRGLQPRLRWGQVSDHSGPAPCSPGNPPFPVALTPALAALGAGSCSAPPPPSITGGFTQLGEDWPVM